MDFSLLALGLVLAAAGWFWRRAVTAKTAAGQTGLKKQKVWSTIFLIAGLWCLVEKGLQMIFGSVPSEAFTVDIFAERVEIGGVTISATVLATWAVMAVVLVLAQLFRLLVVPRFREQPRGIQNALEICVEGPNIVLRKYRPTCVFCDAAKDVQVFRGKNVCPKCLRELREI